MPTAEFGFYLLKQDRQMLFVKSQMVNVFGFVGHLVFVATSQLCCGSTKAATDNM